VKTLERGARDALEHGLVLIKEKPTRLISDISSASSKRDQPRADADRTWRKAANSGYRMFHGDSQAVADIPPRRRRLDR
jgi:hypothetical protein